ncbi:protein FAM161A-like [Antennarius striatus]|uniref:protein FAM161A-like n=1 Tax=Antennarius striatus TaxID=241820 RepID=UPI0035B3DD41
MTALYRSASLENQELIALYGRERDCFFVRDDDYAAEEYDPDLECSASGKCDRSVRSSLSMEIYGLQREQNVYFSNLEYYRRLEELKSTHLRNMAELERMYISQDREARQLTGRGPTRKLQRINSQEELDFHDTSSGSDQSELYGTDSMGEQELEPPQRELTFRKDRFLNPDEMIPQKQILFQSKASSKKPQGRKSPRSGSRVRTSFKVTVPKPFQMMLREEERKRHKVRTRSEIELENTLLKQELEELRECQKKFKASPAPAHIHLPLYEMIGHRSGLLSSRNRGNNSNNNCDTKRYRSAATASPQPFQFLERERRKREAKILAELGKLGQKEERQRFKARPMPSAVYGTRHKANTRTLTRQAQRLTPGAMEREATEGQSDPNSDLDQDSLETSSDAVPESCRNQMCPCSKSVKKQIELSIEMVKERAWSCTDLSKSNACTDKGDYISV